jgi:DNA-binding NtrC family response regulator
MPRPRGSTPGDPSLPVAATHPMVPESVAAPRLGLKVEREGGEAASREVTLDGDFFRIGSHPSNDLVLDDRHVSRFHALLSRTKGVWQLSDSGSTNGTRINGVTVREADLPSPDCRIELGESVVSVDELLSATQIPILTRPSFGALYGQSVVMRKLFAKLERVSLSDANVLIEGESGTGKEIVASEIVKRGERKDAPFVVVDCSAIAANLIESTLFGHARGAFTGADRERLGAFEAADGGTVFLDEIGELPLDMQPKLLRALEAGEVCRLGETRTRSFDVRVIAATNRCLEQEMNARRFREDLYFRIAVVTIRMPPLRERLEDLPLLVPVLLESLGKRASAKMFTEEVLTDLARHDWPGNVRELRNYLERAIILESASRADDAPTRDAATPSEGAVSIDVPFKEAKEKLVTAFEVRYLADLLDWAGGNVSRAAKKAGLDRMHLHRLISRFDLRRPKSFTE